MQQVHHYLDTADFSKQELLDMLQVIRMIKTADKQGCSPKLLQDASLAMIFESGSTRTRVSFEVAMTELGGHALYLKPGEIHLGKRESLGDTAQVLSRMCNAIMARTDSHETITGLAETASVPVINAMTAYNHPTQALCDIFTITEHMPEGKKLEDVRIVYVGDASPFGCVCTSLGHITSKLGMRFGVAAPKQFQMLETEVSLIEHNMAVSGGSFSMSNNVEHEIADADFIYLDVWWYHGYDDEKEERLKIFMPEYQINSETLKKAPDHCRVMHCLPAYRGYEITDEVMDSDRSIVFDQAENRLHTEKGLLVWYLYPRMKRPSETLKRYHDGQIRAFMDSKFGC